MTHLGRLASAFTSPALDLARPTSTFSALSARAPSAPVALGSCPTYDRASVTQSLSDLFTLIGGVQDLVKGKWVTVKVNLTGGIGSPLLGLPPGRTYQTHFAVVLATAELLRQAGARHIRFVESVEGNLSQEELVRRVGWDWAALQAAGGNISFEDTHNRGSYQQYVRLPVPWGGYIFPSYDLNQAYQDTDVFVSLAKLKEHVTAGVTLSVKNSFGITPNALYGNDAGSEDAREARQQILHHGAADPPASIPAELRKDTPRVPAWRVPRVTADLLGSRPIDLAIIDGIETVAGGEGPWVPDLKQVRPGLLVVGRNAVCTDAVATAVMGHDPLAPAGTEPFPGDNHLQLAAQVGLGTNDPAQIEVRGLSLDQARFPFSL